ncbi:hypothetical protein M3Y94_01029500 [Aphelenchoides besseyi]|nr:hypothetical protein M3Y94_01029500 [Aphelenchoides besseyi]KAI6223893.1 hypothetical protein M3Y95_00824800 [Aphelenchoides besseyi]
MTMNPLEEGKYQKIQYVSIQDQFVESSYVGHHESSVHTDNYTSPNLYSTAIPQNPEYSANFAPSINTPYRQEMANEQVQSYGNNYWMDNQQPVNHSSFYQMGNVDQAYEAPAHCYPYWTATADAQQTPITSASPVANQLPDPPTAPNNTRKRKPAQTPKRKAVKQKREPAKKNQPKVDEEKPLKLDELIDLEQQILQNKREIDQIREKNDKLWDLFYEILKAQRPDLMPTIEKGKLSKKAKDTQ